MFRRPNLDERFPEGELNHEIVRLGTLEMIAKYSFIAHKSVNYLDLSLREFSSLREKRKVLVPLLFCSADPAYSKKFVCTAESCRKTLILERRWLYTLHLDLPVNRENQYVSLTGYDSGNFWKPKTICFNELLVKNIVYQKSFRSFVKTALLQNGMEMNFVRKQMALMKRVLEIKLYEPNSIEDQILYFLYPNCTDSEIIKEFLSIIDFHSWVLTNPPPEVFEYLVFHAHKVKYDLQLNDVEGTLVNECFFNGRYKYAEILLQYHNAPFYYNYDSNILVSSWLRDTPTDWCPEDLEIPFQKGLISKRRYSLWLQIFHAYTVFLQPPLLENVISALRLLWRSLPDAFFTLDELESIYRDVSNLISIIRKVSKFYLKVVDEDHEDSQIRSLQHCCRVTIRKSLCYSLELPFGIEHLPLPDKFKAFLRLET